MTSAHRAVVAIIMGFAMGASAQYGTAPSNYYPETYDGSTFTGVVVQNANEQITLTYTKGNKTDTFTGRFEAACSVPSTKGGGMMPSDVPDGTVMTAFFNTNTKKVGGQKVKENVILAIALDTWQGQKIAEDRKKMYLCTGNPHLRFKAFAQ